MKLKSLYIKMLLSFLGVLFTTFILIIVLFVVTAGRSFKHHYYKQSIAKLSMFKQVVQEKIDQKPLISIEENKEINELLHTLSDLFDLEIWVTATDNEILIKTFSSPINIKDNKLDRHVVLKDGIKVYHLSRSHFNYYAQIPIEVDKKINTLHIHLNKEFERKPEPVFLIGLLCIGAVIAILLIPLTRIITKRIKDLERSALEFADGNLSRRTEIKGFDEIAKLGDSFNFMADKLEKLIQGNKELTANISHELRSPLTRIRVAKELIQDQLANGASEDIKRYIQNIDQDIEALDDLIDKVLKLSKMDFHEPSLSLEQIDFKLLFKNLKERYLPSLEQKNLILKIDTMGSLLQKADKNIVTSILSNLIDNAVKYTEEGGTIHIAAFKPKFETLSLSITNTYRKLEAGELEKLFEPFYRIEGNNNPGSGLGLTIIKKQLNQCNSNIFAENSQNGLTFKIEFDPTPKKWKTGR
ncbi:MAG: HAMP domain-containing histidine kinase [Desulfobacterales bacterium]|nr:HAMP domain-containing histidine kinase [Desulfobacterales bacterium]